MSRTKTTESEPEKADIPVSLKSEAAAEWVPTGSLVPNPRNAELRDNADAIPLVAESIKRFGFGEPIVARFENRMVIAGHTRLAAAGLLKLERVPVRFLDLSQDEADLLMLADNRLGEKATWKDAGVKAAAARFGFDAMALAGWRRTELPGWKDGVGPGVDANGEWVGMPAYESEDQTAWRQVMVSFACQEDIDAFAALIGQKFTDKTRFTWYPEAAILKVRDKVWTEPDNPAPKVTG